MLECTKGSSTTELNKEKKMVQSVGLPKYDVLQTFKTFSVGLGESMGITIINVPANNRFIKSSFVIHVYFTWSVFFFACENVKCTLLWLIGDLYLSPGQR